MALAPKLETGVEAIDPEIQADARRLIADLRDAARDGRLLADRFAEVLKWTVEEYCNEFELRAEDILKRLELNQ